ncbi:MAG: adenylate/guanylate cyclase domain-containing protein, partial [Parafilimonas sp.]
LFTDIVGSTSMMQKDEEVAMSVHKRYTAVLKESVLSRGGEILNDFGDGSLCTFHSATEALRCAIGMQQQFQMEPKVPLRIGLHVGEIFFEDGKVFGDGVNVASRLQSLGIANSILFSSEICSKIKNQQEFKSVSVGRFHFKNVDEPMEVFALTNEGLTVPKKEELTGKLKEIEKKSKRRKWLMATAMVLLLVAAFFIYKNLTRTTGFTGGEKSIAVLPFENNGADNSEEYISDGITQDIINNLSKISSLQKVIGWISVKHFKKTTMSVKQIAEELGVAAIVSGTIQKQGDKAHIIAELTEVSTNKRLWGDDFEYGNKELLNIQSTVAKEIVSAMKGSLTPEEKKSLSKHYTENAEAYKLYRKGRYFWDTRTKESFDSAEVNYKRALALDPDYALAYAGLADCYTYNQKGLTQLEAIPISRDYAMKALSLDSTLSEALATLGLIQSAFDYDWSKSKKTLEKALSINPNYSLAHMYYGNLLQYTGQGTEQGIKEIKKAIELDPLSVQPNWVLGRNYWLARQYDLAYEQLKKTLALDPKNGLAKGTLALVLLAKKDYSKAFDLIKQFPKVVLTKTADYMGPYLSYAYSLSGDTIQGKAELKRDLAENPDRHPYFLARAYTGLKDYKEALNQLETAYNIRYLGMYFIKVDPTFDPIRNEPRFKSLIRKMNLE